MDNTENINIINKIIDTFSKINIKLDNNQANQFFRYYEMLIEKNKVMNLTTIVEFEDVLIKHFVDSVIASDLFLKNKEKIIDVGTGAGFPGIPLKIVYPEKDITLLDSLNKRLIFLDEVIEELKLKKVRTVHSRAEDAAQNRKYREMFDCSISRAVANLSTLCEYTLPFIRINGLFAAYKAGNIEEELDSAKKAITVLGGEIQSIKNITLPDLNIERNIILIRKIKHTPAKFPRKAGLPQKEPIQ